MLYYVLNKIKKNIKMASKNIYFKDDIYDKISIDSKINHDSFSTNVNSRVRFSYFINDIYIAYKQLIISNQDINISEDIKNKLIHLIKNKNSDIL